MSPRPDEDDPYRAPQNTSAHAEERATTSPRLQFAHGVIAALAVDTVFNIPALFLLPLVRPENIAGAAGKLLLGVNILVGYVGGRAAARRGLSHEDARAQWTMAWSVAVLSMLVAIATQMTRAVLHPARVAAQQASSGDGGSLLKFFLEFAAVVLLVRFGYAMGTYAQAKREGRARDDQDEAGAD